MSRCILVSGFHRSGTSMTMQALHKAGVYLGDNLIGPNPFNVDGHFENTDIVELHNSMLSALDSDWLATDLPLHHRPMFTEDAKLKANSIVSNLSQQSVWGFKDPRASLFLWDWQQQIPNLFVVAVFRHYLPCIQSLRIRAARELALNPSVQNIEAKLWKEPSTGLKSWITYNKCLIEFCKANRNSVLLVQQETIVRGFALAATVNKLADANLNIHADTGISASKSSNSVKLPLPLEQIDKTLIDQAEEIWNTLSTMADTASETPPSSIKRHETYPEIKQTIQSRLSKVDFNALDNLNSVNTQTPIKLQPPLHEYAENEIETYRARLRNSLKNKRATPASKLISQYEQSGHTTYFGEMLLAEKAIVSNNFSAAKIILDKARNLEPKDGIEPFLLGCIEEHVGNLSSATTYFAKASREMPDNLGFWIARIRTLCNLGEQIEALQEIESALTAIGRNLQLELRKAVVLDNLQQLPLAIETLERSVTLWPDNLSLLNTLYRLMNKAGKSTEAQRYFKDYASLKIRQNKQYTGDILQLFTAMDSDADKRNLWRLIDAHLHDFDI